MAQHIRCGHVGETFELQSKPRCWETVANNSLLTVEHLTILHEKDSLREIRIKTFLRIIHWLFRDVMIVTMMTQVKQCGGWKVEGCIITKWMDLGRKWKERRDRDCLHSGSVFSVTVLMFAQCKGFDIYRSWATHILWPALFASYPFIPLSLCFLVSHLYRMYTNHFREREKSSTV